MARPKLRATESLADAQSHEAKVAERCSIDAQIDALMEKRKQLDELIKPLAAEAPKQRLETPQWKVTYVESSNERIVDLAGLKKKVDAKTLRPHLSKSEYSYLRFTRKKEVQEVSA